MQRCSIAVMHRRLWQSTRMYGMHGARPLLQQSRSQHRVQCLAPPMAAGFSKDSAAQATWVAFGTAPQPPPNTSTKKTTRRGATDRHTFCRRASSISPAVCRDMRSAGRMPLWRSPKVTCAPSPDAYATIAYNGSPAAAAPAPEAVAAAAASSAPSARRRASGLKHSTQSARSVRTQRWQSTQRVRAHGGVRAEHEGLHMEPC